MEKRLDLSAMFHPRSVALIGASTELTKLSGRPFRFFREYGYAGHLYPVNPKYQEILGVTCYESLAAIPDEIDLAVITLPASAVPKALAACGAKGVKAAAIISSGFAEVGGGGIRLQKELQQIARDYGLLVCGPNCSGFIYVPDKVTASFSVGLERGLPELGATAFVSQSGALSSFILGEARERGLGFNYWITTGNECVLGFADYLEYLLEDPQVRLVLGYLEDARNGQAFQRCARRALILDKPLILMKVGRSEAGARAGISHTGSLAGADEVYQAVFSQNGILRAENMDELFDLAMLARISRRPRGNRVQILTCSGAAGILMADVGSELGLEFPDLSPSTIEELKKIMPPFASLSNPMDLTAEIVARPGLLKDAATVVAADPRVDNLVVFLGIMPGAHERLAHDIANVAGSTEKLVLAAWFPLPPPEARQILWQAGVPLLPEPARGIRALAKMTHYVAARERALIRVLEPLPKAPSRNEEAQKILDQAGSEPHATLSEVQAKGFLRAFGLSVPRGGLARDSSEASTIAQNVGWPVVMKACSRDLPHKTEAGVIRLGLAGPAEVERAFVEILEKAKSWNPSARIEGILVEEMVTGDVREVIVGARQDLRFGPVVTFGLGGIFVEAIRDFSVWPAPLIRAEAVEMIRKIRGYRILTAFRGRPAADLEALAEVLCRIGDLAWEFKDRIAEIEINPLFVFSQGNGVIVGDALAVLQ